MNTNGFDHVEMYVDDAAQAASRLCAAFGFRVCGRGGPDTGLVGCRSVLLGQGGIRILLTSALADDHPAREYVARHGDGVAAIAFAVPDAARAYAFALDGGAQPVHAPRAHTRGDDTVVTATVSGFGDVVHRLVSRRGPGHEFLPGAIDMAPGAAGATATDPDPGRDLLRTLDHVAVCVPAGELDPTVRHYERAFGFTEIFAEYVEIGDQGMRSRVVQSPAGQATFTILQPDEARGRGQLDDFLDWHGGAGVQHLAFLTADIVTAIRGFSARGAAFASTPASYYDLLSERAGAADVPVAALREVGALVDRDHWGQMFQIFTQSTHPRRTFFLELIERRGARTFGTNNIKALYEAKERELAGQRAASSGPA